MIRVGTVLFVAATFFLASTAEACTCVRDQIGGDVEAAGEEAYREADLVVEATVGPLSEEVGALCRRDGRPVDPALIGRRLSGDRPVTVHRVIKGRQRGPLVLPGAGPTVYGNGCVVGVTSCDVNVPSGMRTILLLRRVFADRYDAISYCGFDAFRRSARGRALLARIGRPAR